MADDIVTRLRDVLCCCAESYLTDDCDVCKAADEIERLRHELGTVHADFAIMDDLRNAGIERLQATIIELRAEIQRLEQVTRG